MHRGMLLAALAVALCSVLPGRSQALGIGSVNEGYRSRATGCRPVIATIDIALPDAMAIDQKTDRVFVASQETYSVYLVNGTTGTIVRRVPLAGGLGGIAIDGATNHAFVADHLRQAVSMLSASTGSLLRTVGVSFYPDTITVASHEGHVFTAGYTGTVSMLDARTGSVLHTLRLGSRLGPILADEQSSRIFIGTDNGAYIPDAHTGALASSLSLRMNAHILALERKSGDIVVAGESGGASSARFYTARIAVLSGDGTHILRSATIGKYAVTSMVDAQNGNVFISRALTNAVDVVDLPTLRVKRTVPLPQNVWGMAVMPSSNHVFVTSYGENPKAGVVTILDSIAGKVLGAVSVGPYPDAAIADEVTQRVFVANTGNGFPQEPGTITVLNAACWRNPT